MYGCPNKSALTILVIDSVRFQLNTDTVFEAIFFKDVNNH